MNRIAVITLGSLLVSACGQPESPAPPMSADRIIHCGAMIDGVSNEVLSQRSIVIRDHRITQISSEFPAQVADAEILDLSDYTCLPGLIDMHVHVDGVPEDFDDYTIYLRRTPEEAKALAAKLGKIILDSGFTTVRNVGTYQAWVARDLRDQIDAGDVIGPRIRFAGPYLTIPHGGGDLYIPSVDDSEIPDNFRMGVARGADEFRAAAKANVDGGADFLKIIASGAVFGYGGVPGAPEMTPEEIQAVVDVAKAAGIKVTAHAHSAESIKDAILAGVDSIEHASLGDDESVALAVEHDVAFSMDVYNGTYTAEVGEAHGYAAEFMQKNDDTTEAQRVVFRKALEAGVTLMFGTDLGVLPHHLGAKQFAEMVKHGMDPMHVIQSATSIPANHMGMESDVGALTAGRYADIVAVRGNPVDDITLLQNVSFVIKGGEVINRQSEPAKTDAHTE